MAVERFRLLCTVAADVILVQVVTEVCFYVCCSINCCLGIEDSETMLK